MVEPYTDPEQMPPPRPRKGCLWGCLAALLAIVAVTAVVFIFGARHFYGLLNGDAHVRTVMTAVNASSEAAEVLGRNITVQSRRVQTYSYATGRGGNATYILTVVGSNGSGEVKAELDITGDKDKITSLILTDSEGHPHYIVGMAPSSPMLQNSI